ncbi:MAG: extracellular solute-binding protein [Chloroflexi bacterium]|nr:extracellular solute-binding protein [Chloroflexota bacterium]
MNSILTPDYNLAVNTTMVRPDEIKSYNDLLDPRWKGKIVLTNPTVVVRMFTTIASVMGLDWWRKLAANQEPVVASNDRQVVEWLAHGKYPIAIFSQSASLDEFVRAGAPVKRVQPKEGSSIRGGIVATGLLNRAPHPNAAKVFANWFLSKEGGLVQSIAVAGQSARLDVPVDHLDPELRRDPSAKYVDTETEEFFLKMAADRVAGGAAWEVFGTLTCRK